MKKWIVTATLVIAGLIATGWAMLPPSVHEWTITDPSTAQEHVFTDEFHAWLNGSMSIRVSGRLDHPASLVTPVGKMNLPKGEFDLVSHQPEIGKSSAVVTFTPWEAGTGTVKVQVGLGTFPEWARGVNGNCVHCVP